MANTEDAGSTVQTKVPGRAGAVIKTGGQVGGGMSQPANDGGASKNSGFDYLRSAPGKAPLEPTKPAGGGKTGMPQASDNQANESAEYRD